MLSVLFMNAMIRFSFPQNTEAADLLKYFHLSAQLSLPVLWLPFEGTSATPVLQFLSDCLVASLVQGSIVTRTKNPAGCVHMHIYIPTTEFCLALCFSEFFANI